jgi:hypothetical protein
MENPNEIFSRRLSLLMPGRATVDTRKTALLAFLASLQSSNSLSRTLAGYFFDCRIFGYGKMEGKIREAENRASPAPP